ncbi:MAG TPA: GT4 family glycosyltransferase PelF [Gemmatimonadales bacterium]|nr:GT4 family glycosyltransferase PelF [Gemmatimonadales bacterium]
MTVLPLPATAPRERLRASQARARATVVQVLLNLGHGGMERMAVTLATGLDPQRFRAVVVALDEGGEHEALLRDASVEYHVLGGRRFWQPRFHWTFARLLRRLRPAVVHTHHFGTLVHSLPAAWLARVPRRVHTEHSYQYLEPRPDYRRLLRGMSATSDAFVVVAHSQLAYYADCVHVPARRLCVIPNGIDTTHYQPRTPEPANAARRALGLAPDAYVIGTAGRFFPEKDYGTLVRGVAALFQTHPHVQLVLIGEGPQQAALEALVASLGIGSRVRFAGWRIDLADVLPALDVFVLSSRSEGLPLVALEASACGVPVVATPVGDVPQVIADGRTGVLFPIGDDAALSAALRALADAPRRRAMGLAGRERVVAHYSQRAMVDAYVRLYEGRADVR